MLRTQTGRFVHLSRGESGLWRSRASGWQPTREADVVSWIVRGLLIVSGTVTGWFVSKDAPNFGFIQGMASLVVIAVFVLAF